MAASATLLAVALPSSVFAIGLLNDSAGIGDSDEQFSFTPAAADPDMAALIAQRSGGKARLMRFTPASAATSGGERSVTVAVRLDQETADALSSAQGIATGRADSPRSAGLSVAPTRYNLGLARGFGNFAQTPARAPTLSRSLSDASIPDISEFSPPTTTRDEPSRFAARVEMDEARPAGRTRNDGSVGDQLLDVGGSYSLTGNIEITAGVRIEQDRDIVPLPDLDQQDSQAVYIGTQFRF